MKLKKFIFVFVLIIVAELIATVVICGKQYYNDRYVGADYYAMVPLDYDMAPDTMYNMNGGVVGTGKWYRLTAYNEKGEAKEIEFKVMGEIGANHPQPGTILHVKASKQLVVGWNIIEERDTPENVIPLIKGKQ